MVAAVSLFVFSLVESGGHNGWKTPCKFPSNPLHPHLLVRNHHLSSDRHDGTDTDPTDVPALFVVSIILFIAFFLFERHLEKNTSIPPAAKPSVFTRNNFRFTYVMLAAFFSFFSIGGWIYCATIWYQNMKGMTPIENAIHVLPCAIAGIGVGVSWLDILAMGFEVEWRLMRGSFWPCTCVIKFELQSYSSLQRSAPGKLVL